MRNLNILTFTFPNQRAFFDSGQGRKRLFRRVWLVSLLLLFFSQAAYSQEPASAAGSGSTTGELKEKYAGLKESTLALKDKLGEMGNVGGETYSQLGTAVSDLATALSGTQLSPESIEELAAKVNNLYEDLKKEEEATEYIKELEGEFSGFKTKAQEAIDYFGDVLENGFAFTTPVGMKGARGDLGFDVRFDNLRFIQGKNQQTTAEDSILVDAYAAFQFPFAINKDDESTILKFRGTNINLGGGGFGGRISLASNQRFNLQENKIDVIIYGKSEKDGKCLEGDSTWIELDCGGVKNLCLVGAFEFQESFIKAADGTNQKITAHFTLKMEDGFIGNICFNKPFKVSGAGDFVFEVIDALYDMSETANAESFTLPYGYVGLEGREKAWNGFALKQLKVTIPNEMTLNDDGGSTTLDVTDMLIDEFGLSGKFLLANIIDKKNENSGLNLSLDSLGVAFLQGELVSGILAGGATVPFLTDSQDQPLDLKVRGELRYDKPTDKLQYSVQAKVDNNNAYNLPFEGAKAHINRGSYFSIDNMNAQSKTIATLNLNGAISIDSKLSIKGLNFEGLKFSNAKPHVSIVGLGLDGSIGFSYGGFSIAVKDLFFRIPPDVEPATAYLDFGVALALIGDDMGLAAEAGFRLNAEEKNKKWKLGKFEVKKIYLDADFSAFRFKGSIKDRNSDTDSGFEASLGLTIKPLGFGIDAEAIFGHTKAAHPQGRFKYWYTAASVDLSSFNILLFPPGVFLKSISGGVYQRMDRDRSEYLIGGNDNKKIEIKPGKKPVYVPDKNVAFGFKAGIGLYFMRPQLVAANVEFEMNFNTHGGLNYIGLEGNATILSEDPNKDAMLKAWLKAFYDRENEIFHTELGVAVDALGLIKGSAYVVIHTEPKEWYFHMGSIEQPCTLEFAKILKAKSYFMIGKIPHHLPPLSPIVAKEFGEAESQTTQKEGVATTTNMGRGFAFGIGMYSSADFSLPLDILYGDFMLDGGLDVLVDLEPGGDCGDWRGKGRVYTYASGKLGATVYLPGWCKWHPCMKKKKMKVFSGTAASKLEGEVPKPFYFKGDLKVAIDVWFISLPRINIGVKGGKKCN